LVSREGGGGDSKEDVTAASEKEKVGQAAAGRGEGPVATVRDGAGCGAGDGARGLHLRSCETAPEGCNASRDAYNSATPKMERTGVRPEGLEERPCLDPRSEDLICLLSGELR
jgi:hypothetical protein